MRQLLIAVVVSLLVAPLCALTACGGGGTGGGGDPEGARSALIDLLDAGNKGDLAKALPHLDVVEWLVSAGRPQAATYRELPKAERDALDQSCFNAVVGVMRVVKLPDHAAITAAVKGASLQNLTQLKAVQIHFVAPDAEREGKTLAVDAKLRYGIDRVWRLVTIEADL